MGGRQRIGRSFEMKKVAVITGAGSGVGRATAIKLAQAGWNLVLIGRTVETLRATAGECGGSAECLLQRRAPPLQVASHGVRHGQTILRRNMAILLGDGAFEMSDGRTIKFAPIENPP